MKKLGVSYSGYFNHKYDRCGHLFQDRYKSEIIYSEIYLLTVFRYILKNPLKAGICPAGDYPWSSYQLYEAKDSFVDCSLIRNMIGDSTQFRTFMADGNDEECMDFIGENDDEKVYIEK